MCGIAGLWRLGGPRCGDAARLARMAAVLVHRGPDDFGYLLADAARGRARVGQDLDTDVAADVLLASRRLSIIDASPDGRQPLANETGDVFVVFNGAIHNYVELRRDLESRGHVFRSRTDTEVIVHAYEEWGEACAGRFNGMWAYAIWDQRRKRLVCSRDRFGIKPLYIAYHDESFHFASEAKAILAAGEIEPIADLAYVRQFLLRLGYPQDRGSAFVGISQLAPGHNLVVTRDGRRESRYWAYTDRSQSYDFSRPGRTFRELLEDSVRLRLRSDVPIAILLSGGLDSSSITAIAARQIPSGGMDAFTATFPGFRADERRHAATMAAHAGIRLHGVEYDAGGLMKDLDAATWHMDCPVLRGQILARWRLLEAASRHARVVFEGQGADEMLGGYPWRYLRPYLASELDAILSGSAPERASRILAAVLRWGPGSVISRLRRWRSGESAPVDVLSPEFADLPVDRDTEIVREEVEFPDRLRRALHRDHALAMLPHLLHFGDAISMAHSVESRLPFLDHRLVEFVFGLPFDTIMRGGTTKYVMREAMAPDLPLGIVGRRDKIGFEAPIDAWMRPRFAQEIRPILTSRRFRERELFDPAGVDHWISRFEGGGPGGSTLFRCLAVERWFELFIDGGRHAI